MSKRKTNKRYTPKFKKKEPAACNSQTTSPFGCLNNFFLKYCLTSLVLLKRCQGVKHFDCIWVSHSGNVIDNRALVLHWICQVAVNFSIISFLYFLEAV